MDYMSLLGGGDDSGGGTGIVGDALGIGAGLRARDKKKDRRAMREARAQARNEALFNYGNQQRATERLQDLAPEMTGYLQSDYLSSGMLMPTSREEIGGAAMESLLNASSGYNPVMAHDPSLAVLDADRDAVAGLRANAEANTEGTLGGWEAAMAGLADEYEAGADKLAGDRDEMKDAYMRRLQSDRAEEDSDLARAVVEAWISSNDRNSVGGREEFLDRRGRSRRSGKVLGADEAAKREWVEHQLELGASYEELLNDPEFESWVRSDENAGPLYGQMR